MSHILQTESWLTRQTYKFSDPLHDYKLELNNVEILNYMKKPHVSRSIVSKMYLNYEKKISGVRSTQIY